MGFGLLVSLWQTRGELELSNWWNFNGIRKSRAMEPEKGRKRHCKGAQDNQAILVERYGHTLERAQRHNQPLFT